MNDQFYSAAWTPSRPDFVAKLDEDTFWEWQWNRNDDEDTWIESSPIIHPAQIPSIARSLNIEPEEVVDVLEGYAKFDGENVTYLEPLPGLRLQVHVANWDYQRKMWAIWTLHDESAPPEWVVAAAEIMEDAESDDPLGIKGMFDGEPDDSIDKLFEVLGDAHVTTAVWIPANDTLPNLPREGGVFVENPLKEKFGSLARSIAYGDRINTQRALFEIFDHYGLEVRGSSFHEMDLPEDEDVPSDTPYWYVDDFEGYREGERYDDVDPGQVIGLAFTNDGYAIDFPYVTLLVSDDGVLSHRFPSSEARLVGCFDGKTLTFEFTSSWAIRQYDLQHQEWLSTPVELPRVVGDEGMEQAFLLNRSDGSTYRMSQVCDYPKAFGYSTCGTYIGARDKELSGSVYREDGEEQFWIGQGVDGSSCPVFDLQTGAVRDEEPGDDATDEEWERWEEAEENAMACWDYQFACCLTECGWRYADSDGYRTRMAFRFKFRPSPSAMAFSRDGTHLLLGGPEIYLLECSDDDQLRLLKTFSINRTLLGEVVETDDRARHAALSRYGTIVDLPDLERLKATPVWVDYETDRLMSHAEATALLNEKELVNRDAPFIQSME